MKIIENQASDSLRVGIFLTLSGGFQDAYSYLCRGKVFANAQTGNIVLLGQGIAEKNFGMMFRYLLPLLAFVFGAYISQKMKLSTRDTIRFHWRQRVLIIEMSLMALVGFLPEQVHILANIILSFVCAMQVVAFSKFNGNSYATTMCIGNLRSATTSLCLYHTNGEEEQKQRSIAYFTVIFVFLIGSLIGAISCSYLGLHAIWIAIIFLMIAFVLMFEDSAKEKHLS